MFVKKILRLGQGILRFIKVIIDNLIQIQSCLLDLVGETDFKEGEV